MLKVNSSVYMCSGKELQYQIEREFDYAALLMGRANYPTVNFPSSFHPQSWLGHVSAEDCTWDEDRGCTLCPQKSKCPYEIAKALALRSALPILNTAYFMTEANGPGRFSGRGLVIADEADLLESSVMGWVSVEVSKRRMEQYGWSAPKLTVESDWLRWCQEVLPYTKERMTAVTKHLQSSQDVSLSKELKYLMGLRHNLRRIVTDMERGSSTWVYDGDRDSVAFKPSKVRAYGESVLWSHAEKWLLMSATIISVEEVMWSLGWREGEWEYVEVANTFPVKNRRVIVRPVADMSFKAGGRDNASMVGELRRICFAHPNDRILVHTVSYAITDKVSRALRSLFPGRTILAYTSANARSAALAKYKSTPGAILCGPSLDRGVDLAGDLCRVQVVVKVPFANMKDKVVNARYHSGDEGRTWYTVNAIRTLVQMTGRAIRSEEDWAETYILDSAFRDKLWFRGGRQLFPKWWQDGLVWER